MHFDIYNMVMMFILNIFFFSALTFSCIKCKRVYNFQVCGFVYVFGGLVVYILGATKIIHPAWYPAYTGIAGILPFIIVQHSKRFSDWFETPFRKTK